MTRFQNFRRIVREALAPEPSDPPDTAGFLLLILFVLSAPFLYGIGRPGGLAMGGGVVQPAGTLLLELFAYLIASISLLSRSRARSAGALAVPLIATAGIAVLGVIQLLPLPERILQQVAPLNTQIYHDAADTLRSLGGETPPSARISIAPTETLDTLLLVLAYLALFLSSTILLRNRLRRRVFTAALLAAGVLQVALAAILKSPAERAHGTFVNPNHLAAYLEVLLAVAFGALWAEMLTNRERARRAEERADRLERRLLSLSGFVLLWAVIAAGIALTQSRGGILTAGLTMLVLVTLALAHRRTRSQPRLALAAILAILGGIVFVATTAGTTPLRRFFETHPRELGRDVRVELWKNSVRAWREFPIVGSGLGTFREAFRRVQPRKMLGRVEHAHSDSLQLLVTGGTIGAVLGIVLFVSMFLLLLRAWRAQKHREESAMVLAGAGALFAIAVHGLVDFNLSIPVIPATLACVLGMAWAAGGHR
jgi:O-antigen ligase